MSCSPVLHAPSLVKMGLEGAGLEYVGSFTEGQRAYLAFHRDSVFLQSRSRFEVHPAWGVVVTKGYSKP
jgi:hypothetical protein